MSDTNENLNITETLTLLLGNDPEVRDILELEIERFETFFGNDEMSLAS